MPGLSSDDPITWVLSPGAGSTVRSIYDDQPVPPRTHEENTNVKQVSRQTKKINNKNEDCPYA